MIFDGHLALQEKNDLRHAAMLRKMNMIKSRPFQIGQYEFSALECLERIFRNNPYLPFVEIVELNEEESLNSTDRTHSEIEADGTYKIFLSPNTIHRIEHYVEEIFGNPWSELRIKVSREQRGINYYQYQKPIYDFPAFKLFSGCKINVRKCVSEMALWFIVLHEYAHIQNGHLNYKAHMRAQNSSIPIEVQQAMELHADITAASYLLDILYDAEKYIGVKQIVVQNNGKDPGVTFCDNVAFTTIAAYLALRCFLKVEYWDEYTVGIHRGNHESHPLTELRMSIVFNVFLQGILDHFHDRPHLQSIAISMLHTVEQFEDFYFQNKGREDEWIKAIQYNPTQLLRTTTGQEYYHEMFEHLLALNDILEPYTTSLGRIEGTWCDYETLPERMFWS